MARIVKQLPPLPAERVLAVGDALHTDIAGAAGVDVAACWVLSGIHGDTLADGSGQFDLSELRTDTVSVYYRMAWTECRRARPATTDPESGC